MNTVWRAKLAEYVEIAWTAAIFTTALVMFGRGLAYCLTVFSELGPDLIAPNGMPLGSDFLSLWSGGWLAVTGNAPGAYDPATMDAAHNVAVPASTSLTLFHYPPTYLMLMMPFGAINYVSSLILFVGLSLIWFSYFLYKARPHWTTALLVLGYPALWLNILGGQNAFLSGALMGLAMLSASPFWQGVGWGLLTYKPQLGMPVPVALLAGQRFKTILWAVVTALAFALLSLLVLGPGTWQAFFIDTSLTWRVLVEGLIPLDRMSSALASIIYSTNNLNAAIAAQVMTALIGAVSVAAIWSSRQASANLRHASLVIAMLMATPHLFHYDLAIMALPLLLFIREAESTRWLAGERLVLYITWLGPFLALPSAGNTQVNYYFLLPVLLQLLMLRRLRAVNSPC